ncbi:MAG: polysaccharide deacetylase family protein, partial [Fibrobacter sp.]|nr:polysaccharide deacetylase family protein [Fibrobacter sp.]
MKMMLMATAVALGAGSVFAQEIGTWSGFRSGAASFTFDDGAPSHVSDVGPLFEKYGYRATFNLVVNWNPDWSGFQKLADNGHDIASHSNSH